MVNVRIIKTWEFPDLRRQSPQGDGRWGDLQITCHEAETCDYVVVLTQVPGPVTLRCSRENVWLLMQEPPSGGFRAFHRGASIFSRVYTQNPALRSPRYILSQPALPWHVNRSYSDLKACLVPDKPKCLSWITSDSHLLRGHRHRMDFLRKLRGKVEFDLFGRGFRPIDDKWDGLAPYRYSLAVENFRGPAYWTEKVADPLLSWTMPIYCGCTDLRNYLPAESFVEIDINSADAVQQVREIVASDLWIRRREAIAEARRLILDRYQIFPFLAEQIAVHRRRLDAATSHPQTLTIPRRRFVWGRVCQKVLGLVGLAE